MDFFRLLRFSVTPSILVAVLSGCSLSPLAKRTAAFGTTAALVIRDSSTAYDTVERKTYEAGVSNLVLDFDGSGFDRTKIRPFLKGRDLEIRQSVLRGLGAYADDLSQIAGEKGFEQLDEQTTALSQSLVTLSRNGELLKLVPGANETEAKGLATAVDTLGRILIERRRRAALPKVFQEMQPVLERLCGLLDADIGSRPGEGQAGHGLRDQLWHQYDALIDNQVDYIRTNRNQMPPSEKAAEVAKLPKLVAEQQSADAALASTQNALRDLVKTHGALLLPQESASFQDRLAMLIQDGQQIAQFYGSLASK